MVLPVLVTFLFAIIEISYVFFQVMTVSYATRQACRRGITGQTEVTIESTIQGYCNNFGISANNIVVTVYNPSGTAVSPNTQRPSGHRLEVATTYSLKFLTPVQAVLSAGGLGSVTCRTRLQIE